MVEIASRNSGVYARLLMGRAWHAMLNARQKEVAPYHVFPRQAYLISILYKLGHKATLSELAKYAGRGINTLSTELKIMEKDSQRVLLTIYLNYLLLVMITKIIVLELVFLLLK